MNIELIDFKDFLNLYIEKELADDEEVKTMNKIKNLLDEELGLSIEELEDIGEAYAEAVGPEGNYSYTNIQLQELRSYWMGEVTNYLETFEKIELTDEDKEDVSEFVDEFLERCRDYYEEEEGED